MLTALVVLSEIALRSSRPLAYIVFPALIWAALRLGRHGAAAAIAIAAGIAALAPAGATAEGERASLPDIEDEVMCPICGTTLELSEAPQAERERALIRRLIAEGRTKEEIKDALVAEYGEEVLATPGGSGFDLAAWVLPVLGLLAALAGIALAARRLTRRGEAPMPPPLDPAERARLEREIRSEGS